MTNAKTVIKKHSGSPRATPRRKTHIAIWRSVFLRIIGNRKWFQDGSDFYPRVDIVGRIAAAAPTVRVDWQPPSPLVVVAHDCCVVGWPGGGEQHGALSLYGEFLIKRRDRGILPKVTEDTRAKILMQFFISFADVIVPLRR